MYPLGASKPFEIMDLGGNVREWTDTVYRDSSDDRAVCGGAWYDGRAGARPSAHVGDSRFDSYNFDGFRLVSPIGF